MGSNLHSAILCHEHSSVQIVYMFEIGAGIYSYGILAPRHSRSDCFVRAGTLYFGNTDNDINLKLHVQFYFQNSFGLTKQLALDIMPL